MVYGTEGAVLLDGNSYTVFDKNKKVVKEIKETGAVDPTNILSGTGIALDRLHFQNFVGAIRNGDATEFTHRGREQERDDAATGQHRLAGRPRTALRPGQRPHSQRLTCHEALAKGV